MTHLIRAGAVGAFVALLAFVTLSFAHADQPSPVTVPELVVEEPVAIKKATGSVKSAKSASSLNLDDLVDRARSQVQGDVFCGDLNFLKGSVDTLIDGDTRASYDLWELRHKCGMVVNAQVGIAHFPTTTVCTKQNAQGIVVQGFSTSPSHPYKPYEPVDPFPPYDRDSIQWSVRGAISHYHGSFGWELARREANGMLRDQGAFSCKENALVRNRVRIDTLQVLSHLRVVPSQKRVVVTPLGNTPYSVEVTDSGVEYISAPSSPVRAYYGDMKMFVDEYSFPVSALWYAWDNAPDAQSFNQLLDGFVSTVSQEDATNRAWCTAMAIVQNQGKTLSASALDQCVNDFNRVNVGFWLTPPNLR